MQNEKLKELFDSFLTYYQEEKINDIWSNQSSEFKEFWNNKIMKSDDRELYDQEIDEIVKILDRFGKGNTKDSEAIARVMIPQGAWRRLFNQLKEEKKLSNTIDSIFTAKSDQERTLKIDELYQLNLHNKNNLSGKSGNAINCLLAAYNPFENLSIVSLNDRKKLLDVLGVEYSMEKDSVGVQIEITSGLIKSKFKEANIFNNARTISTFAYSKSFKDLWKMKETNDDDTGSEDVYIAEPVKSIHDDFIFYMEKQLEDFLIENWDKTELGKKFDLIVDDDGLASQQYKTDIGIIDILAKDKKDGKYVVIELKKNQTSDDCKRKITMVTVAQLQILKNKQWFC